MTEVVSWGVDANGDPVKTIRAGDVSDLPPAPEPQPLSPRRFEWMLASSGLDLVWDEVETLLKGSSDPAKKQAYASLRASRRASVFIFSETMAFISRLSGFITAAAPTADVSEPTIRALWAEAEQFTD